MSIKLNRQYELTIYPTQYLKTDPGQFGNAISFFPISGKIITIKNPFTITFNIQRKAMSSVNTATIQIYNLEENTRNQLYKDKWSSWGLKRITLKAGYSNPLPIIFDGNIRWCTSTRGQGQTNFITEIEAFDWAFPVTNSYTSQNFPGEVNKQQVIDQLVKDITSMGTADHHVNRGYIHTYTDKQFNVNISEVSWDRLRTETQDSCFIDNGYLNILNEDECFRSGFPEISSSTGLLGSPKRSETYVLAEMLFEPSLVVGQSINLKTTTQKIFNGEYKVYGINHFGTISDAVNGKCQTNVSLFSFKRNMEIVEFTKSLI